MENAQKMGNRYIEGLKRIQVKHPTIGDIRGEGLMLGVDFVKNPDTRDPHT